MMLNGNYPLIRDDWLVMKGVANASGLAETMDADVVNWPLDGMRNLVESWGPLSSGHVTLIKTQPAIHD